MTQIRSEGGILNQESYSNSPFGFFLLCVYTVLVFVRPHEWPAFESEIPILRTVLIFTFISYLFSLRPKSANFQGMLLVLMSFFMLLSELRAGRGFSDLTHVQTWIQSCVLPFFLYLGFLNSFDRQKWILFISLAACMVMIHQANSQLSSPIGQGWAESLVYRTDGGRDEVQVRYIGIFNDPNDMGMFLVMHIPVTAFLFLTSQTKIKKVLYLTGLAILVLGVWWTGSRGSLLGLLAVFFSFFYIRFGKIKSFLVGGISAPLVLFATGQFRAISKEDESALHRLIAWQEGLNMWGHRPFVGFGKGRFLEYHGKTAHNSFILIIAELGTVGFVLWVTFIYLIFYFCFAVFKADESKAADKEKFKREKTLALYLLISVIGYCTTAFFISRSYIIFFYVFAAMVAAMYFRAAALHPDIKSSVPSQTVIKAAFYSFIGMFALQFLVKLLIIL